MLYQDFRRLVLAHARPGEPTAPHPRDPAGAPPAATHQPAREAGADDA